jgi:hypothetical protein
MIESIKEHIKKNYLAFSLYVLITTYFLFQHYAFLSWDFSAYVLNARYLFYGGSYFELYRAPLMPILIGFFMIFGSIGEYIYIFFSSTLFYISIFKLSKLLKRNFFSEKSNESVLFFFLYFLINGTFVYRYGTLVGTELLSLSFFILFLTYFLEDKYSGHFLALAFLTRYNFVFFLPLIILRKDYKKIIMDFVLFFICAFPWFLWNFVNYGNWFSSFIDSYFLNVYSRQHIIEPFNWMYFLNVFGWKLPLFMIGLFVLGYILFNKKRAKPKKIIIIFVITFIIIFYDVYSTPFKVERYLFNFILPIAVFSLFGLLFLINRFKIPMKVVISVFLILFLISLSGNIIFTKKSIGSREVFSNTAEVIKQEGILHCNIRSSIWVPVSYYTENVYFLDVGIEEAIKRGNIVLIFKGVSTIDDRFTVDEIKIYEPFYENDRIILFGDKENCTQKFEPFNFAHHGDLCWVLSSKFKGEKLNKIVFNICEIINFNKKELVIFR